MEMMRRLLCVAATLFATTNVCRADDNAVVAPWLSLSPSVQLVDNPGGDNAVADAVVVGLRAQGAF